MTASVSALVAELKARAEAGMPVTVGLAGCGQMGTDIVVQLFRMPGLRLGAIAEMRPEAATAAALLAGFRDDAFVHAGTASAIDRAIEAGRLAITSALQSWRCAVLCLQSPALTSRPSRSPSCRWATMRI